MVVGIGVAVVIVASSDWSQVAFSFVEMPYTFLDLALCQLLGDIR